MSGRLVGEVLNHSPADLTDGELIVLIAIAESANDDTREAWPGIDNLARRARRTPDAVRKALGRLAKRGLEVRIAVGTNRNGEPVFAYEGTQTRYRVPSFAGSESRRDPGLVSKDARRDPGLVSEDARRDPGLVSEDERRDPGLPEAGPGSARDQPPVPPFSSKNPHEPSDRLILDTVRAALLETKGRTFDDDFCTKVRSDIELKAKRRPAPLKFYATVIRNSRRNEYMPPAAAASLNRRSTRPRCSTDPKMPKANGCCDSDYPIPAQQAPTAATPLLGATG